MGILLKFAMIAASIVGNNAVTDTISLPKHCDKVIWMEKNKGKQLEYSGEDLGPRRSCMLHVSHYGQSDQTDGYEVCFTPETFKLECSHSIEKNYIHIKLTGTNTSEHIYPCSQKQDDPYCTTSPVNLFVMKGKQWAGNADIRLNITLVQKQTANTKVEESGMTSQDVSAIFLGLLSCIIIFVLLVTGIAIFLRLVDQPREFFPRIIQTLRGGRFRADEAGGVVLYQPTTTENPYVDATTATSDGVHVYGTAMTAPPSKI